MSWEIHQGDALDVLRTLASESVHCCVTSPPYWGLRDYGVAGQLGLEKTPEEYVAKLVAIFGEVRRVLRDDGVLWLNLGDSYASHPAGNSDATFSSKQASNHGSEVRRCVSTVVHGLKPKDLVGIPWRVAFALQADGWYLRSDIIWHKPNPMPESVTDRPTKAHEYVFLLSKSSRYFYDKEAIKEESVIGEGAVRNITPRNKGQASTRNDADRFGVVNNGFRNCRSVWTVATDPYSEAHFAVMPPALADRCIKAGCPVGGVVLDPSTGLRRRGLSPPGTAGATSGSS